jgi:hypothetical protein
VDDFWIIANSLYDHGAVVRGRVYATVFNDACQTLCFVIRVLSFDMRVSYCVWWCVVRKCSCS